MIKTFLKCFKNSISRLQRFQKCLKFDVSNIKNEPVVWLLHKRESLNGRFWEIQKSRTITFLTTIYSDKTFLKCFKNSISRLQRFKKCLKIVVFDIKNEQVSWLLHKRRSLNCQFWETQKCRKIILLIIIYSDKTFFEMLQK